MKRLTWVSILNGNLAFRPFQKVLKYARLLNRPTSELIVSAQDEFDFDILDATKLWPEEAVPVRYIGELELNRNIDEFFTQVEQVNNIHILTMDRRPLGLIPTVLRPHFARHISCLVLISLMIHCSKVGISHTLTRNFHGSGSTGNNSELMKDFWSMLIKIRQELPINRPVCPIMK
jgi:Catalase